MVKGGKAMKPSCDLAFVRSQKKKIRGGGKGREREREKVRMKLMLCVYTMQNSSLKAITVQNVIPRISDVGAHYAHRQWPLHMASVSADLLWLLKVLETALFCKFSIQNFMFLTLLIFFLDLIVSSLQYHIIGTTPY